MFYVVEFTETKAVNIVPELWYNNGITWWPNYTNDDRINKAIKKCEDPGQDWNLHDVRVLAKTGDYLRARDKLRASLTCHTSELQTDDEQEVTKKRKIKPRIYFDADSDSEDGAPKKRQKFSSAPAPPIPQPTPNLQLNDQTSAPFPEHRAIETSSFIASSSVPISRSTTPSSPLRHFSIRNLPDLRNSQCGQVPEPPVFTPVSHQPASAIHPPHAVQLSGEHQESLFSPRFRLGRTGTGPIPCSAAQLHILTLLENLREQQMQLVAVVNSLAAQIAVGETPVAEMPHNVNIPAATMSDVEELEEWLKDSQNAHAKQNMISTLGCIGGPNIKRVTWNILARLFSDPVAKQINWKGVNGKRSFKEMLSRCLLIRAVKKNHGCTSAADTEIESHAIRWFNLATDRGGGRKERSRAQEAEMPHGN